ncbi:hypothetical protein OC846_005927 [Tilletia horrida]|uniref:Uncharacterized protein n=1 Tax=Tilletia horrida TaxID=155126 RepID=A0AAN6GKV1_9BASI|nr:hypothetical protein OC846_005927 [Tilletia horrida]
MSDRPHLPPRPSTGSNQPPIATRKLVAPPRRPGAPVPGGTSAARSTVLSPASPAVVPSSAANNVTATAAASTPGAPSSSFPLSSNPNSSNILPPPIRRLPIVSTSAGTNSPTLTPITLDNSQPFSTSPAASTASTEANLIPKLPPRKQPSSHPRSSFPPVGSSPQHHQSHIFQPTNTLPPATALNSSNATAALLPPPVRTNRPSLSSPRAGPAAANANNSTVPSSAGPSTSTLSGTPPRYLPPPSHQQSLQQKASSPTAAIIHPAARARYEALFDRELAEQKAKRKLRRIASAANRTATATTLEADSNSLSRSLGASPNTDTSRASPGPPQFGPSSFKGGFGGRSPVGIGGYRTEGTGPRPPGSRHKFGTSDPSFNMSRGSSQSEHASNDSHSGSQPTTTAVAANVSALKGFFEGKTSSGPASDGSMANGAGRTPLPTSQPPVRPPERTMTKSNTDTTLLPTGGSDSGFGPRPTLRPQLSSYNYPSTNATTGVAAKSPFPRGSSPSDHLTPEGVHGSRNGNGNGNGTTRLRAVSASSAGPSSPIGDGAAGSRSPLDDDLGVGAIQTSGGGAAPGNGKYPFQLRVRPAPPPGSPSTGPIHTSNSLRSLSSKNLRADALAASSSSRPSSSSGTSNLIRFSGSSALSSSSSSHTTFGTPSSADRLSPRRIRKIWRRSHLRTRFLAKLWDVMGGNAQGMEREMFVRSMAAIDFELAKKSQKGGGKSQQQRAGSSQQQQPVSVSSSSAVGTGRGAGGAAGTGAGPARGRAPDRVW